MNYNLNYKMNLITNIKKSYKHIPYTFKHWKMVLKLEKKYIGYYKYPFHDLDKLFMYIFFPYLGTKIIQKIHTKFANHHLRKYKKHMNFDEAILDWESARFTKPDKPLDAWDTYQKYFTEFSNELLPIFEKFNLKH